MLPTGNVGSLVEQNAGGGLQCAKTAANAGRQVKFGASLRDWRDGCFTPESFLDSDLKQRESDQRRGERSRRGGRPATEKSLRLPAGRIACVLQEPQLDARDHRTPAPLGRAFVRCDPALAVLRASVAVPSF